MAEEGVIQTVCPHCKTFFEVPPEMIGEVVECAECQQNFTVQPAEGTDAGDETVNAPETGSNTVKMNRSSIGMMPELTDEATGLGVVRQRVSNSATRTNIKFDGTISRSKMTRHEPPPPVKRWWQFWK